MGHFTKREIKEYNKAGKEMLLAGALSPLPPLSAVVMTHSLMRMHKVNAAHSKRKHKGKTSFY